MNSDIRPTTIVEQKEIPFTGDVLTAVKADDNKIYAAMKPICENVGVDWDTQRKKIRANEILDEGTVIITVPSPGGNQPMVMMDVRRLPAWLMTINTGKVRGDMREKLKTYQRKAADVLADAFIGSKTLKHGERQRGIYDTYRTAQMVAKASLAAAKLFGTRDSIARAVTAQRVRRETGIDWNELLIENKAEVKESLVIPTTLGKALDPELKPNTVNKILQSLGLQTRFEYKPGSFEWKLTKEGKNYGDMIDIGRKHSDKSPIRTPRWYMDRTLPKIQEFLGRADTEVAN